MNWWVVVRRVQMGISIWDAVHSHSMDRWALSGADVQAPRYSVTSLRRSSGGWMSATIGRLFAGVGRRHPVTVGNASLIPESMRRVWALWQYAGPQYSSAEWTRAEVAVRKVVSPEPQLVYLIICYFKPAEHLAHPRVSRVLSRLCQITFCIRCSHLLTWTYMASESRASRPDASTSRLGELSCHTGAG